MRLLLQACQDDGHRGFVKLRASSSAQHLHDLKVRVLLAASSSAIVLIRYCIFDDDHMARQFDTHSQGGGTADDIEIAFEVSFLNCVAVIDGKTGVMVCYPGRNSVCTRISLNPLRLVRITYLLAPSLPLPLASLVLPNSDPSSPSSPTNSREASPCPHRHCA